MWRATEIKTKPHKIRITKSLQLERIHRIQVNIYSDRKEVLIIMNKLTKLFGIAGLTTLTALSAMGMGTVNVLADNAQLPAYVMDGTNAERAISDYFVNKTDAVNENSYFVNKTDAVNENSVVIPHMDIIKSSARDNGKTVNMYGAFEVAEYVQDGNALKEDGTAYESHGCFTLTKNTDGTYAIESYKEIPDNATKADFVEVFGKDMADEAFEIYCKDAGSDLWKTIFAEDAAYYSYDNNLGLGKIEARDGSEIALAGVSFSTEGAHTMYAQTDANVRSAGTTEATAFDGVERGGEVKVTGMANGWGRVEMNGRTGYISSSLLGDKKPAKEEKKEDKKEEKKAEKKEEKKADETIYDGIERRGYICGTVEAYSGNWITVNGVKALVTERTNINGTIQVGDDAKLEYFVGCDAVYEATSITDNGKLPEGEARVSDGRIVEVPVIENEYQEPEGSEQEMPLTAEEAPVQEPEGSEQEIQSVSENDNAPEEDLVGEVVIDEIDEQM